MANSFNSKQFAFAIHSLVYYIKHRPPTPEYLGMRHSRRDVTTRFSTDVARFVEKRIEEAKALQIMENDGPGLIYVKLFIIQALEQVWFTKIGRTQRTLYLRLAEHRRSCPSHEEVAVSAVWVPWVRWTERLVHRMLEKEAVGRPQDCCRDCSQEHREIFAWEDPTALMEDVLLPLIYEAAKSANTRCIQQSGSFTSKDAVFRSEVWGPVVDRSRWLPYPSAKILNPTSDDVKDTNIGVVNTCRESGAEERLTLYYLPMR
ncbi:hypothetical protein V5O48_004141 [Marasmius crinis-equi]|uniref:Bacteriophage T5 Orf172 DNA-binding domain-containing protein n=1 Tax=Marasmius crinis-equi TaxID=585013 RepID=A0ABR3FR12_9AGAR